MSFDEAFDMFCGQPIIENGLVPVVDLYIDRGLGMNGWVYSVWYRSRSATEAADVCRTRGCIVINVRDRLP
jgi:hypothetical protein